MNDPNRFARHPRLTLAVIVVVLLAVCDLGATAAWQWLHPKKDLGLRVKDPVVHHGLKPLVSGRERWGRWDATYHTNDLGMRDASPRRVPLVSGGRRILFIGDSFTEGIGIDWPETFVGRVAAALAPRGIEVLNAGCASYCPAIYDRRVRQLLDRGLRVDEIVVYVDVGDVLDEVVYKHDAAGNVVGRETRRIREERANRAYEGSIEALWPLQRFLEQRTIVAAALYRLALRPRSHGYRRGAAWTFDPALDEAFAREGLTLAFEHMDSLHGALRARGVALTVGVYPWPDQILARDLDSRHRATWRNWARERGAGFVDHFPQFVDARDPRQVVRRFFIPGDIHWNAEGHEVMARGFLDQWSEGRASH
jgi:hypothetical protein